MADSVNGEIVRGEMVGKSAAGLPKAMRVLRCLARIKVAKDDGADLGTGALGAVRESATVLLPYAEASAKTTEATEIAELRRNLLNG